MAHKLAIASPHISADVIEVSEFPEMAQRYTIYGVPKTVINDAVEFEGAVPEATFVQHILRAAGAARAANEARGTDADEKEGGDGGDGN